MSVAAFASTAFQHLVTAGAGAFGGYLVGSKNTQAAAVFKQNFASKTNVPFVVFSIAVSSFSFLAGGSIADTLLKDRFSWAVVNFAAQLVAKLAIGSACTYGANQLFSFVFGKPEGSIARPQARSQASEQSSVNNDGPTVI